MCHAFEDHESVPHEAVKILNSLPYCSALLDKDFSIVTCNNLMLEKVGHDNLAILLNKRPGDVLKCINTSGGYRCGMTNKCHECSLNRLLDNFDHKEATTVECRIINTLHSNANTLELKVNLSPIDLKNRQYIVMTLENMNEQKRKEMLNKTFLHDVLNTACGLTSLVEYIGVTDDEIDFENYIKLIQRQTLYIIEEIKAQKELISASSPADTKSHTYCLTGDVLKCAVDVINHFAVMNKVSIKLKEASLDKALLFTDQTLIRRVLVNLFKNAIESADEKEIIEAGCTYTVDSATFYIKNSRVMDAETKSSIFNRLYTTKNTGSGLGTQSIKLLTEKYLGGTVHFSSEENTGTIFYVTLPVANPVLAAEAIIQSTKHI